MQVFSGVIFFGATVRYGEIVQSREYTSQHTSRTGDVRRKTSFELLLGYILLPFKLTYATIIQILAQLVSFHSALQFIMSGLRISSFAEAGGLHKDSEACNQVEGAKGFDSLLAYLSTALAYVILPAAFYEIAKVICPVCPSFAKGGGLDGKSKQEMEARKHLTFSRKDWEGVGGRLSTLRAIAKQIPSYKREESDEGQKSQPNEDEQEAGGEGGWWNFESSLSPEPAQESIRKHFSEELDRVAIAAHRKKDNAPDGVNCCCKCPSELSWANVAWLCKQVSCANVVWLFKLTSTLLSPDLMLALVSSQFPATLDGASTSRAPPKKKPAQSSTAEAAKNEDADEEDPGWLRALLDGTGQAAKDLWTYAQVPLETFPLSRQEGKDYEMFKDKVHTLPPITPRQYIYSHPSHFPSNF